MQNSTVQGHSYSELMMTNGGINEFRLDRNISPSIKISHLRSLGIWTRPQMVLAPLIRMKPLRHPINNLYFVKGTYVSNSKDGGRLLRR